MNRHWRQAAWLFALAPISALITTATAAGPAKDDASESGWVSLFDGKTTEGWVALELPNQKQPSKWEVVDGMLVGSGGQSMIFSPRGDYTNFKFRAEVKINDKGNSGMYFRTPKGNTFTNGYEAQINSTHADPIKSGSIYTFVHIYDILVPPDTFFTQEVEVKDVNFRGKTVTNIKVRINGKLLYEFNDFARTWTTGHFAFQQHDPGSRVTIRKVEVMELPATKK